MLAIAFSSRICCEAGRQLFLMSYSEINRLEVVIKYVSHKSECKIPSTLFKNKREDIAIGRRIAMSVVWRRHYETVKHSSRHSMLKKRKIPGYQERSYLHLSVETALQ